MAEDWNPEYKNGEEVIGFITGKSIITDTRKSLWTLSMRAKKLTFRFKLTTIRV